MAVTDQVIRERLLALCEARAPDKTCCPSEIARELGETDWRGLMPRVREQAARLIAAGHVQATQKGRVVDIEQATGPIRLRRATPD